jgi:hypothetical protein
MQKNDRTIRSLAALAGASSSRVLNLAAVALENAANPNHADAPMFDSTIINRSIILKHRLRADELDLFTPRRAVATKIIIPFERTDLKAGGRSFFVGQRGFEELLREAGNYGERLSMKRDLDVLRLMDSIPSLDPFLLREHLRSNDVRPNACYFAISAADQERMYEYTAREVRRLTSLAVDGKLSARDPSTGKVVAALLSAEVSDKLEPLRATLKLAANEFTEGVFSWRGFLYYKWSLEEFWPHVLRVLRDIRSIRPIGSLNADDAAFLSNKKQALILGVQSNSNDVRRVLGIYDQAYGRLIDQQDPKLFRDFLLNAPTLFFELGEKIGAISHITSFWRYRFPDGAPRLADVEELMMIFQDFAASFPLGGQTDIPQGREWSKAAVA